MVMFPTQQHPVSPTHTTSLTLSPDLDRLPYTFVRFPSYHLNACVS